MTAKGILAVVFGSALSYTLLYEFNGWLFSSIEFSQSVNWIFLPSGIRLLFVLLFVYWGALGLALSSFVISMGYGLSGDYATSAVTGVIAGLSPLLARKLSMDFFKLDVQLGSLTSATLLKTAALFALLSAISHQAWFSLNGNTEDFLSSTAVMAIGDFIGTVIVLYVMRFVLMKVEKSPALSR